MHTSHSCLTRLWLHTQLLLPGFCASESHSITHTMNHTEWLVSLLLISPHSLHTNITLHSRQCTTLLAEAVAEAMTAAATNNNNNITPPQLYHFIQCAAYQISAQRLQCSVRAGLIMNFLDLQKHFSLQLCFSSALV